MFLILSLFAPSVPESDEENPSESESDVSDESDSDECSEVQTDSRACDEVSGVCIYFIYPLKPGFVLFLHIFKCCCEFTAIWQNIT